jgi:hypothetical protein
VKINSEEDSNGAAGWGATVRKFPPNLPSLLISYIQLTTLCIGWLAFGWLSTISQGNKEFRVGKFLLTI